MPDSNDSERKTAIWNEIVGIYKDAVLKIEDIRKKNPDVHLYSTEKGWDDERNDRLGLFHDELDDAESIVDYIYEESAHESNKSPYIYTDAEIADMKENRELLNIKSFERSIEAHQQSIDKYRKLIKEIREKHGIVEVRKNGIEIR